MGWNAIVVGDLRFPEGTLPAWRTADAAVARRDWPPFVAQGLEGCDDEETLTVDEVLESDGGDSEGETTVQGEVASMRYTTDGSNYAFLAARIVRLVSAAARSRASGRVIFCSAEDALGAGLLSGAVVTLEGGQVTSSDVHEPLGLADRAWIDEVADRVAGAS